MSQPSFYAVIPANVRYDKTIPANAKLLYGEITALCSQEGYCWATNSYFAELYEVSETSISKWISSLVKAEYICLEIDKEKGNTRLIYLKEVYNKTSRPIEEKLKTPIEEKLKHNNTIPITTNSTTSNKGIEPFSFTLKKDTHFDNLSDEYKNALKIEIEALGMGLPYQAFVEALQAKASYKYKNFLLAYKNWAKKDFNKGARTTKYDGMVENGQISKEVANTMDVLDRMKW